MNTSRFLVSLVVAAALPASQAQAYDFDDFSALLESKACATAINYYSAGLDAEPLYAMQDGECVAIAAAAADASTPLYADSGCLGAMVTFEAKDREAYCEEIADKSVFGNDPAITEGWRLPPWPTLQAGVLDLSGNLRPFETRRIYAEPVAGCSLEMHIFKPSAGATDLKPLMLIHGGSWKYRQTGVIGLYTQMSHYTDAGFVVFSPMYRLTGEGEAAAACSHAAGEDIVSDIELAYQWVQSNATRFGAADSTLYLAGQSAGAHLAARMAVDHPETTVAAMLLYPPTDFRHFLEQARGAGSTASANQGIAALEGFLGGSIEDVSLDDTVVTNNSFPQQVQTAPDSFPPMYMIHGAADQLVPVEQSLRLCNAFGGDPASGHAIVIGDEAPVRQSFSCGSSSRLDVITDADHILDFCLEVPTWASLFGIDQQAVCPAGNAAAQAAAADAVSTGITWLAAQTPRTTTAVSDSSDGSSGEREVAGDNSSRGGGSSGPVAFVLLATAFGWRRLRH